MSKLSILSKSLATNFAAKEKSLISKDATDTAIEGYFKFLPSKAAPTVPDKMASEPKFGPGFIPETTISGSKGHSMFLATFTQSTGLGQAHNNLQPYIVVYMWRRTA